MSTQAIQPTLFPECLEERSARLDNEILLLLMGRAGGPLGLALDENEKAVLRQLRFIRGAANAMQIRELQQRTSLDPRSIKQAVRGLRITFHLPVGSSKRGQEGGYFLMLTDADRRLWVKDVLDQVRAELAVVAAAAGRQAALEALGQLHLDVDAACGLSIAGGAAGGGSEEAEHA